MASDPLHLVGTTIDGKYDVQEYIEHRGSRLVYRGRHRVWAQPVALVFLFGQPELNPAQRQTISSAFLRAGGVMARLSTQSSALVQARDAGVHRGPSGSAPYVVFEWVGGPSLSSMMLEARAQGRGRVGMLLALDWFGELMRAVSILHAEGMTHGAVHPGNIFVVGGTLRPPGPLKLRGLTDATVRSVLGGKLGMPLAEDENWAPPELRRGSEDPRIGPWTDVWGLGRIFAELLVGRELAGDDPDLGADAPSSVVHVLRRSGAAIEERYPTVEQFRAALVEAVPKAAGSRSRPRQTMVVSQQVGDDDGSAGSFEVAPVQVDEAAPETVAEPDAPRARIRFAKTQRIGNPVIYSEADGPRALEDTVAMPVHDAPPRRPKAEPVQASSLPSVGPTKSVGGPEVTRIPRLQPPDLASPGMPNKRSGGLLSFLGLAVLLGGVLGYVATFFVSR